MIVVIHRLPELQMAAAVTEQNQLMTDKQGNENCGTCKRKVKGNDRALQCNLCDLWHHIGCERVNEDIYRFLIKNEEKTLHWYCGKCNVVAGKLLTAITSLAKRQDDLEEQVSALGRDTKEKIKEVKDEVLEVRRELNKRPDIGDMDHVLHNIASMNKKVQDIQTETNKMKQLDDKVVYLEQLVQSSVVGGPPQAEKNAAESLSPKNSVQATVSEAVREMEERKLRENNIVIFGVQEKDSRVSQERIQHDLEYVKQILVTCGVETEVSSIRGVSRLGKYDVNRRKRPLHVGFTDKKGKMELFKNIRALQGNPEYTNVSITNDLTKEQREQEKKLLLEAKNLTDSGRGIFKVRGPPWARKVIQVKRQTENTVE